MFPFLMQNINVRNIRVDTISLPYIRFSSSVNYIKRGENDYAKTDAITGGILGFFVSGAVSRTIVATAFSQEEIQSSVKSRTHEDIYSYYTQVKEELKKKVNSQKDTILREVDTICNNHIKEYGSKVESLIKEQEATEKKLEDRIAAIKKEIDTLEAMENDIKQKCIELKFK
jgi:hypothetical protein